jgi:hypothetical protein
MSSIIWTDNNICTETSFIKKAWFIRDGRTTDKEANWEREVMYIVVKKSSKHSTAYGPVFAVSRTMFKKGKGKDKVDRTALLFLCLSVGNFISLVLDPEDLDCTSLANYLERDTMAFKLHEVLMEKKADPWYNWFPTYVESCEEYLYPKIQVSYERLTGAPWKKPLRLKMKKPSELGSAGTSSRSPTMNTSTREEPAGRAEEPAGRAESPLGAASLLDVIADAQIPVVPAGARRRRTPAASTSTTPTSSAHALRVSPIFPMF